MDATELLEKAHDILVERGVHRGHMVDPEEGKAICSLGALSLAAGATVQLVEDEGSLRDIGCVPSFNLAAYRRAAYRLQQVIAPRLITSFNDDPANSDEDIILAMKRAAHDG